MFQTQSGMTDGMIQIQIDLFTGPAYSEEKLLFRNQDKFIITRQLILLGS